MEEAEFRLHEKEVKFVEGVVQLFMRLFRDGGWFVVTDREAVTFCQPSQPDLAGNEKGFRFGPEDAPAKVLEAGKVIDIVDERGAFGTKHTGVGGPVWNDADTRIIGTWSIMVSRRHLFYGAFDSFAGSLAEMLPEGGFVGLTDLTQYIKRQGSKKFDMPQLQVGTFLSGDSVATMAMKQKENVVQEIDEKVFGFPVLAAATPVYDVLTKEMVGAFTVVIPRKVVRELKKISGSLDEGLTGVAVSIEQIAAATNDVSGNQERLHGEITQVKAQLDNINSVMAFIKKIADETTMLGLNAAIEAARVGEAGRGFGVVAEEIRKLSEESKNTVAQIKELTAKIEQAMVKTAGASESTLAVVEETSAAVQEINATVEELISVSNLLKTTALNM